MFLSSTRLTKSFGMFLCTYSKVSHIFCSKSSAVMVGTSPEQLRRTLKFGHEDSSRLLSDLDSIVLTTVEPPNKTGLLSFARRLSLSRRFMIFQPILILKQVNKCTEMHDKSSRDDNQVVGMFCFQSQHSTGWIFLFLKYWLATPKSLSGVKANIIIVHAAYYRACGTISQPPRLRQKWAWHH